MLLRLSETNSVRISKFFRGNIPVKWNRALFGGFPLEMCWFSEIVLKYRALKWKLKKKAGKTRKNFEIEIFTVFPKNFELPLDFSWF